MPCLCEQAIVKLKDLARVLVLKSSLEVGESFLGLFLVNVALLFHLVNIIIEISWSMEEIWEKGRNKFSLFSCNSFGISL
jgi:hypothetical protein